jgi:RNA polymerase-binding transcription factor DksA
LPPLPPPTPAELAAAAAVAAAKSRALKRKAPYKAAELKELREILQGERNRLIDDLRVLDDLATSNKETLNPTFSSHQADVATDSSSLETSFMQRRVAERRLAEVSDALAAMERGTYGLCETCATDPQGLCECCPYISLERLRAKPFAQMCIPLRRLLEKNQTR